MDAHEQFDDLETFDDPMSQKVLGDSAGGDRFTYSFGSRFSDFKIQNHGIGNVSQTQNSTPPKAMEGLPLNVGSLFSNIFTRKRDASVPDSKVTDSQSQHSTLVRKSSFPLSINIQVGGDSGDISASTTDAGTGRERKDSTSISALALETLQDSIQNTPSESTDNMKGLTLSVSDGKISTEMLSSELQNITIELEVSENLKESKISEDTPDHSKTICVLETEIPIIPEEEDLSLECAQKGDCKGELLPTRKATEMQVSRKKPSKILTLFNQKTKETTKPKKDKTGYRSAPASDVEDEEDVKRKVKKQYKFTNRDMNAWAPTSM